VGALAITITADAQPLLNALQSLSEFPLEVIERFIGAVEAGSQPACVDVNRLSATGAGDVRIIFKPSNFLLEFMATAGTRESDRMIREKL
jgi:hypothetical protein